MKEYQIRVRVEKANGESHVDVYDGGDYRSADVKMRELADYYARLYDGFVGHIRPRHNASVQGYGGVNIWLWRMDKKVEKKPVLIDGEVVKTKNRRDFLHYLENSYEHLKVCGRKAYTESGILRAEMA